MNRFVRYSEEKLALLALPQICYTFDSGLEILEARCNQPDDVLKGRYLEMVNRLESEFNF